MPAAEEPGDEERRLIRWPRRATPRRADAISRRRQWWPSIVSAEDGMVREIAGKVTYNAASIIAADDSEWASPGAARKQGRRRRLGRV